MSETKRKNSIFAIVIAIAIPLAVGIIGASLWQDRDWFENETVHPPWRPPNWLFGPVWTVLYVLMGIASYYVWRDGKGCERRWTPLLIYLIKLVVNWLWTPLFFVWHLILAALIDIVILWVLIVITIVLFYRTKPTAGYLLIPYFIWVSVATALNTHYYILNR